VFPAFAESCDRLLRLAGEERPSTGEMVSAVESEPALAISAPVERPLGKALSLREAIDLLGPALLDTLAERTRRSTSSNAAVGDRARALSAYAVPCSTSPIASRARSITPLRDTGKLGLLPGLSRLPEHVHGEARVRAGGAPSASATLAAASSRDAGASRAGWRPERAPPQRRGDG
jgi:hypothetical protein